MNDVKEDASVMLTDVGRLSLCQLDGKDAKGPHINLVIVLTSALNELWCHPADSSYPRLTTFLLTCQHYSVTEICELDLAISL